jgi:RNA polymerase sigma factor (sigma-70 family)
MEETDLIEQIKNREEKAFTIFIDLYKDMVFRICLSFAQNKEDAEELTQDVFIDAISNIKSFKKEAKLQTWLYRIAINKSLNQRRSRKKSSLLEILGMSPAIEKEISNKELMLTHNNAEDNHITEEKNKILYACIDRLKEEQRIAFTLNKVDGFSYAEVAEIMKISLPKTETLIHRAKKKLQEDLIRLLK